MIGFEHKMALIGIVLRNQSLLGLSMASPEQESHWSRLLGAGFDYFVGELLPAFFGMAGGLAIFHGERGVEQQDALRSPSRERAMRCRSDAQITLSLFEDIAQTGRDFHALGY